MSARKEIPSKYQIFQTSDYGQFVVYPQFHRPTPARELRRLERKILANNQLANWPIWVTEKMEVVDGTRRLRVATKHGLAIYYVFKYTSAAYHKWIKEKYGDEI